MDGSFHLTTVLHAIVVEETSEVLGDHIYKPKAKGEDF